MKTKKYYSAHASMFCGGGGSSTPPVIVSTDAGNVITAGTDGGAFLDGSMAFTSGTWNDATNSLELRFFGVAAPPIPFEDIIGNFLFNVDVTGDTSNFALNNQGTLYIKGAPLSLLQTDLTSGSVLIGFDTTSAAVGNVPTFNGTGMVWANPLSQILTHTALGLTSGNTTTLPTSFTQLLVVSRNGMVMIEGTDYSISGNDLIFVQDFTPSVGGAGETNIFVLYY